MKYYLTSLEGNSDNALDIWREVNATQVVFIKRVTGRHIQRATPEGPPGQMDVIKNWIKYESNNLDDVIAHAAIMIL